MLRLNFFQWFENLKTQAKLLTVFGLVGVIIAAMAGVGIVTNGRLSSQAETVYAEYTIPLTEFNQLLFNLNRYHESLVDVARTPRATDFDIELKDIGPYREEIEKLIASYERTTMRTSSSGRDEAKDLVELKAALTDFFNQSDAAVTTIKESFENKSLSNAQALAMRELGALAITVSLSPAFEKVTRQLREAGHAFAGSRNQRAAAAAHVRDAAKPVELGLEDPVGSVERLADALERLREDVLRKACGPHDASMQSPAAARNVRAEHRGGPSIGRSTFVRGH